MTQITRAFFNGGSSILRNRDTIAVMDFLSAPDSVNQMLAMSRVGIPALVGVVRELEERFGDCRQFPLNHDAMNSNAPNRRNIGWMVRFILKAYGYTPMGKDSADSFERTRIGKFSQYFGTAAVYAKTIPNPDYSIRVENVTNEYPTAIVHTAP